MMRETRMAIAAIRKWQAEGSHIDEMPKEEVFGLMLELNDRINDYQLYPLGSVERGEELVEAHKGISNV